MDLKAKVALVTGAARRVGRVIAVALAKRGATVAVHYLGSAADAEKTASDIRNMGVECMTVRADLAREPEVAEMVRSVAGRFGRLDILINNAAVFFRTPLGTVSEEDWDRTLDSNLKGAFFCSVHAARRMLAQPEGGAIVSIADASASALNPYLEYLPYSISKAGVVAMTRGLARALAPKVRVNAVGPGPLLMPDESGEKMPVKRHGTPEDVAAAVLHLLESPDNPTGIFLPVDGGRPAA